jgi:hypothetical protein
MKKQFRSVNRRLAGAVAVTSLLLVPLGVFGGPALARTASAVGEYGHSGGAQYQYRVTMCHHTGSKKHRWHMITISFRAVAAHQRHGDQMPPCPTSLTVGDHHGDHHGKPSSADSHGQSTSGSQGHEDNDDDDGNGNDNGHHGNDKGNSHHENGKNNGHHGKR